MKRIFFICFTILLFNCLFGNDLISNKLAIVDSLQDIQLYEESLKELEQIEKIISSKDSEYREFVWTITMIYYHLSVEYYDQQAYEKSLQYGLKSLDYFKIGKKMFELQYKEIEYFAINYVIMNYFALEQYSKAKKYQKILSKAYKMGILPEAIDSMYRIEYFKYEDKNVWAYELYPELGDKETEGSFSKIIYYIYDTNADGTDKDQLFRLHILKFHKFGEEVNFDYVLTFRLEDENNRTHSQTLYQYRYKKKLDYQKIKSDIREVIKDYFRTQKEETSTTNNGETEQKE